MMATGKGGKRALGGAIALVGVLILSGANIAAQSWMVSHAPEWLANLTTRF